MGIWDQKTRLVNKTGLGIDFDVDDDRICPLRGLPAGKSRSVSLSRVRKCCRDRGSANWLIRVLINNRFYGMHLHPRNHILKMTRIVLRFKWRDDGSCVPIVEGVMENFFDRVFGCCVNSWEKKIYVEIAEADSTWRSFQEMGPLVSSLQLREAGDPDIVAAPLIGHDDSLKSRQAALRSASWRKRIIRAFPSQKWRIRRLTKGGGGGAAGGRTTPESVINSGENSIAAAERRNTFNSFLLFSLTFSLVACVNLFYGYVCDWKMMLYLIKGMWSL